MSNSYRFDNRTQRQFAFDIKRDSASEAEIALRLCIRIFQESGRWPVLIPTGCEFSGKFVKNNRNVSQTPDYFIGDRMVEITRADPICKRFFHQKVSKINKATKDGHDVVFINGFRDSKEPTFIQLKPELIELTTEMAKIEFGIVSMPGKVRGVVNKDAYRYKLSWFDGLWKKLPVLSRSCPREYMEVLNIVKKQWGRPRYHRTPDIDI